MNVNMRIFESSSELSRDVVLDKIPDICPLCNQGVELKFIQSFGIKGKFAENGSAQVVLQCPRSECKKYSVAYYKAVSSNYNSFIYQRNAPNNLQVKIFSPSIIKTSEEFTNIYNESLRAESMELNRIAGIGYRKSLEFLIKDYLIIKQPDKKEEIESAALGTCINNYVKDANVKSVSEKAVWLGNDETHYVRKWENKDVNDLKKLIDLTLYWIESEILTEELENDMSQEAKQATVNVVDIVEQ